MRLNPFYDDQLIRENVAALQGVLFNKTHRWTKPGSKAIHKSIKKFLIPLIGLAPWADKLYTQAWEIVRNRYVESCGGSVVFDIHTAAQEMASKGVPGTLYTQRGFHTKAMVYRNQQFIEDANATWNSDLKTGKFKPFCDVNGKTEILENEKDPRTVYCVDAMTILFQKMLFGDQHDKYRLSKYEQMWAHLGKSSYGTGSLERYDWITHSGLVSEVYDFDVKKMEANIRTREMQELARLHYEALDVKYRTEDNWMRVQTLYNGMSECPFLVEDSSGNMHALWKGGNGMGGNPSGQVCTALDNSIFDLVLVVFSYLIECYLRAELPSMSWFWLNHHGTVMGDDLQASLTSEAEKWWKKRHVNFGTAFCRLMYDHRNIVLESTNPLDESGNLLAVNVMQGRFCGMRFHVFSKPFRAISFVYDRDRMLSSVQQGDPNAPAYHQLERMNGIRNIIWADEKTRDDLAEIRNCFIRVTEREKPQLLKSEDWERAKAGWLSDLVLYRLYTGTDTGKTVVTPIDYNLEETSLQLEESQFQF